MLVRSYKFKGLLKMKIVSIVRCQTKLSIFVAAEVLRWKRYVAAAARQCFENLSCKFANNCESQLCLAWERPTPPLNPILFYTVEQINRGQQLGRKQRRPPQASCPPPLRCISSSSKMRDLLVEAKSSSRPPPLEQQHEQQTWNLSKKNYFY